MAARVRQFDWTGTALGPTDVWPPELRAAASLVLDSALPAALVWGDDRVTIHNDALAPMLGNRPDALGRAFAAIWGEAWSEVGPAAQGAWAGGSTCVEDVPVTVERFGRPERAWLTLACSPVRRADGGVGGMIAIVTETTGAAQSKAALRQQERTRAFILGLSDALRPIADPHVVAATACRLLVEHLDASRALYTAVEGDPGAEMGLTRGHHVRSGRAMPDRYPLADLGEPLVASLRAGNTLVLADASSDPRLTAAQRQALAAIDLTAAVSVPLVKAGRLVGTFTIHHRGPRAWTADEILLVEDIAERTWHMLERTSAEAALRRLQDRQQLLVAALQHRVRNILTVVRSVFTRTAEADTPLEQVVDHFRGRLDNLARTQVVVAQSASGVVDLHSLIFDELLSVGFAESPSVTLRGPEVKLDATTADAIGLAIHELTTNAIKFGALKFAGATLAIRWSTNSHYGETRTLHLIWTEQGVPAVPIKPARQGFGSELIEEALPYRLGAETRLEFRGGGVRCTISVPLPAEAAPAELWETT